MEKNRVSVSDLEQVLVKIERTYSVRITIIDRDGNFIRQNGTPIFPHMRHSHQANPVCFHGFTKACIAHCRHEVNAIGESSKEAFIHHCWKGLCEIAIPLFADSMHIATFFVGIWRSDTQPDFSKFPRKFKDAYNKLEHIGTIQLDDLIQPMILVSRGVVAYLEDESHKIEAEDSRKYTIRRFISKNACSKIGIKDLAKSCHLSPSRTSHLVSELFNRSFQELLIEERMKRAIFLLLNSDLTIHEIASQIGFCDEYHFNRSFKKHKGLPPGKYRERHRL